MRHSILRTILIGISAAVVSALALAGAALISGQPLATPLKGTAHVLLGPDAVAGGGGALLIGVVIHILSACFWALVAVLILRPVRRTGKAQLWLTGIGTAIVAAAVDYLLMPARLTPGWELALPAWGVALGFAGLGVGLSLGLLASDVAQQPSQPVSRRSNRREPAPPLPLVNAPDALRRPAPNVIDQRQQRIDPANDVTEDPNADSGGASSGR